MNTSSVRLSFHALVALCFALLSPAMLGQAAPPAPAEPTAPKAPADQPAAPAAEPERPATQEPPLRDLTKSETETRESTRRQRDESRTPIWNRGGDEVGMGDHYVPKGRRVLSAVSIFGSTTVEGEVSRDAVSIFGNTTIGPEAKIGGAAVAVLGRVKSQGEIPRDVVSVLGGVDIDGPVGDSVVSILGNLRLGPNAVINHDIVVVGGTLTKAPGAIVRGDEINIGGLGMFGDYDWLTTWVRRCLLLGRPLAFGGNLGWAWGVAFSFLAFYLVLTLLFPSGVDKCVATFEQRPGSTIVASLLTIVLIPIAMVVLAVTIVGSPLLAISLMFAGFFGKAVMFAWIGRRLTGIFGDGRPIHPVPAVLIGGLIVMLLYTIWGSFLLYKLLSWLGLGVVVYTVALSMKREKPKTPPPARGTPPVVPVVPVTPAVPVVPVVPVAPLGSVTPPMPMTTPPSVVSSGFVGSSVGGFSLPNLANTGVAADAPPPPLGPVPEPTSPPPAPSMPMSTPPPVAPPPPVAAAASAMPPLPPPVMISAATLPRAGFGIRLAAMAIDVLLIGFMLGFLDSMMPRGVRFDPMPQGMLFGIVTYAAIFWKHRGTTIGGVICGLKVVRLDDREIDWATAIVRAVSCFLSLGAAGLGFIWVAIDDEKQSWHDKIAGTTVVRVPKGVSLL